MINKTKYRSADSGTGVAENETATPDVPFVDGVRTVSVEKLLKPRGKSGEKEHPGVKTQISYPEINSLEAALPALLAVVGNSTEKALEVLNNTLERAATQIVYDATFGDETKIRAMIRAIMAAGATEEIAEAMARDAFAKVSGK